MASIACPLQLYPCTPVNVAGKVVDAGIVANPFTCPVSDAQSFLVYPDAAMPPSEVAFVAVVALVALVALVAFVAFVAFAGRRRVLALVAKATWPRRSAS